MLWARLACQDNNTRYEVSVTDAVELQRKVKASTGHEDDVVMRILPNPDTTEVRDGDAALNRKHIWYCLSSCFSPCHIMAPQWSHG